MDRQDTKSPNVPKVRDDSEILKVGSICVPSKGVAYTSLRPGVVFRKHRAKSHSHYVLEVGLVKSRWREITGDCDEGKEVADDSTESDGLDGAG